MHKSGDMPKNPPAADLIGSADVCRLADIDRSTLSRHVAEGIIAPAVRLPGRTGAMLFDRPSVAVYIARIKPERVTGGAA